MSLPIADSAIVAMKEEEEGNDGSRNNGMAQGVIINNTNNSSSNCDNNGYWDRPNGEMDITRTLRTGRRHSTSLISAESALDHQDPSLYCGNLGRQPRSDSPPMQALASGAQHSESSAAYFLWPVSSRLHGTAEERTAYFNGLQKDVASELEERIPSGQQASTLLDLMTIRAFHSKRLRRFSLGTAIGFRTRGGVLTNIPAILVFVARKVHKEWLHDIQRLPSALEGPGGVWCDVDVVEFSYYGASAVTPKEQVYTELVEGLRGNDPCIGPGSQVASQETYGTLGAIVQSRTGARQVGFLTNRHVAVDLDYPNQKMFHPLPPNLGPGVYLGAVERATSFITDDLWYGIFASTNPETFVRADGAFIPFGDRFDAAKVTTNIKGVGEMGDVMVVDLQAPISSVVGKQVTKVGRSSGLTKGSVMAYALEYNDEKGICFLTDFLIVGENKQAFDLEGDSGSLILMTGEGNGKPRPVGIIWGGTANRGRLKLHNGHAPENWTSGVDLGRLLDLLQLALITNDDALSEAFEEQRRWATAVGGGSNVGESFPRAMGIVMERERVEGSHGAGAQGLPGFNLGSQHQHQHQHHHHQLEGSHEELLTRVVSLPGILNDADPLATASSSPPSMELLLMNDSVGLALHKPAEVDAEDMSPNDGDDLSFGLNLFDMDTKRRRQSKS